MELTVIGKPYAKAIAEIASENNTVDVWKQVLTALSLIVEDEATKDFLSAPGTSSEQKTSFLIASLEAVIKDSLGDKEKNFIALLVANGKIFAANGIKEMFDTMSVTGNKAITVQSAYALTDAELQDINSQLSAKYGVQVNITTELDSNLQAGVVIKDGDKVVDLSIAQRADALAARLSI